MNKSARTWTKLQIDLETKNKFAQIVKLFILDIFVCNNYLKPNNYFINEELLINLATYSWLWKV